MTRTILQGLILGNPLPNPQEQASLNQNLQKNLIRPRESMHPQLPNHNTKKSEMEVIKSRPMRLATKNLHQTRMVPKEDPADQILRVTSDSKVHH